MCHLHAQSAFARAQKHLQSLSRKWTFGTVAYTRHTHQAREKDDASLPGPGIPLHPHGSKESPKKEEAKAIALHLLTGARKNGILHAH